VAESGQVASDPLRRERLAALGIDVLTMRDRGVAADAVPDPIGSDGATSIRLVLAGARGAWDGGESAALLTALLASIGLRRDEVSIDARPGVPILSFGDAGDEGEVVRLAPLAKLRQPHEKRAAWPALRRLRRLLRSVPSP
jgi:hypothetical protein